MDRLASPFLSPAASLHTACSSPAASAPAERVEPALRLDAIVDGLARRDARSTAGASSPSSTDARAEPKALAAGVEAGRASLERRFDDLGRAVNGVLREAAIANGAVAGGFAKEVGAVKATLHGVEHALRAVAATSDARLGGLSGRLDAVATKLQDLDQGRDAVAATLLAQDRRMERIELALRDAAPIGGGVASEGLTPSVVFETLLNHGQRLERLETLVGALAAEHATREALARRVDDLEHAALVHAAANVNGQHAVVQRLDRLERRTGALERGARGFSER